MLPAPRIAPGWRRVLRAAVWTAGLLLLFFGPHTAHDGVRAQEARPAPRIANPHGKIDIQCEACHTAASWNEMRQPLQFDHAKTGFPLTGRHATTECRDCHDTPVFAHVGTSCADCHNDVHAGRNGNRCQDCHSPERWMQRADAVREHSNTRFPLVGVHRLLECSRCHVGTGEAAQVAISSECIACHATQYAATTNPDHVAAGYSTRCETCHDASSPQWRSSAFDHATTGFPLTGAHRALECAQCHTGNDFVTASADCWSCHQDDYAATTKPAHEQAGFPRQCAACHGTARWQGATFDHNATRFALTGAHRAVDCASCHVGGQYSGTPTDCFACHQKDYAAAQNPNHEQSGFPTQCASCHTTSGWAGADFNHDATAFPLTGAHRAVDCASCHVGGQYAGTPTDCFACHRDDYAATANPNHQQAGFSNQCTTCHTTRGWTGADFNHDGTGFPLTGAHRAVDCASCHVGGQYGGTPTDCFACHQDDYAATTNPNHQQSAFPTQCASCHTTTSWMGADFNHDATAFPLTGAHRAVDCASCHVGGQFTGTPTDCFACHQDDYAATSNPNHTAAGFPNQCATCHNTQGWTGANFNHDGLYFRIYSGKHRNKWNECAICHPSSVNFAAFNCLACHEHNKTKMDDKHRNKRDYRYESSACYNCHRNV